MSEHPIIFCGPMVRAILAGTKTQTRRVIKHPHVSEAVEWAWWPEKGDAGEWEFAVAAEGSLAHGDFMRCPYGVPGDHLWVRETWQDWCPLWGGGWCGHGDQEGMARDHEVYYRADDPETWKRGAPKRWRPSIHMPRWASRLTLEVVSVRVQRVQEITYADARAEGSFLGRCDCMPRSQDRGIMTAFTLQECHVHGTEFQYLWDSINEKRGHGWAENPWVWVVEFRSLAHAEEVIRERA